MKLSMMKEKEKREMILKIMKIKLMIKVIFMLLKIMKIYQNSI
jgi:hypothetical protein